MKIVALIAGILLGLVFLIASVSYFLLIFGILKMDMPPMSEAATSFMTAVGPTGFMSFVKVLELLGAILVAIPRTRRAGLLILGPIVVNIIAYHIFIGQDSYLKDPMFIAITVLSLVLLVAERKAFATFLRGA
jgi:hypothetical protein